MSDFLVIGAGIAGASIAYFLHKGGSSVVVVDQNSICSGGSSAAGAFLSPKISKPSPYKDFVNSALRFSLDFYQKNFPELLHQNQLIKIPKHAEDAKLLETYEPYMEYMTKVPQGYLFENAGLIEAKGTCEQLLENIHVIENQKIKSVHYQDGVWQADGLEAENIILAIGGYEEIVPVPYINIRKIYGYRYDVTTDTDIPYNLHKEVSIAKTENKKSIIGASYIRGKDLTLQEIAQMAKEDSENLIAKALDIAALENLEIGQYYCGVRTLSSDYFPVIGALIDEKRTLAQYPYITTGAKVPAKLFIKHPNLYIHTGHGARGFVLAPYTARLLYEHIKNDRKIEISLNVEYRFLKWSRKIGKQY